MSSRMSSAGYRDSRCPGLWVALVPFTRFWGIATSIVLSGVGADIIARGHLIGVYAIIGSTVIFFLEIMWVITLFSQLIFKDIEDSGNRYWNCWLSLNSACSGWTRCALYTAYSAVPFLYPCGLWLSYVVGAQLLVLAALHLLLECLRWQRRRRSDRLLQQPTTGAGDTDSLDSEYSCRFDEVLDDTLPEVLHERRSLQDDQDLIMEI